MKSFREYLAEEEATFDRPRLGDNFAISCREECLLETWICEETPDGIVLFADDRMMSLLEGYGYIGQSLNEDAEEEAETAADENAEAAEDEASANYDKGEDLARAASYQAASLDDVDEAKYQGREVPLGKPMKGDVKKSKVYVRGPKGNVVKVNFGQKGMKIKKNIPGRRKNFRARHNCDNPGPRWKARYWSCRAW